MVAEKLLSNVKMKNGVWTVAQVTKRLSEQTGLKIYNKDYLNEHKLAIFIHDVSAVSFLNSIVEMNNWEWVVTSKGEVVIQHKSVLIPQNVEEIPKYLNSIFSPALRRLLGEGVTESLWFDDKDQEELLAATGGSSNISIDIIQQIKQGILDKKIRNRIGVGAITDEVNLTLFPKVPMLLDLGRKYPYDIWNSKDRESVLASLLFHALRSFHGVLGNEIRDGKIRQFVINPSLVQIYLSGNLVDGMLMVGSMTIDNTSATPSNGFGHSMDYLSIDLPLRLEERVKP